MKKKVLGSKKGFLFIVILIAIAYLSIKLTMGFPIILESNAVSDKMNSTFQVGDTIHLLEDKEIDEIYIWTVKDDYNELPSSYSPEKLKKITDISTINEIKKNLNFIYTGADVSTCESKVFFFCKNKLIFKSNFLMSSSKFGMQNRFGWIESVDQKELIRLLSKATTVNRPIISL